MRRGEMMQVISNLIMNSIYAMPAGGVISISVDDVMDSRDGILLTVQDDGVGIAPDVLPRVFEAFFTTRATVGTGIGLFVAKEFVEGHGGQIEIQSRKSFCRYRRHMKTRRLASEFDRPSRSNETTPVDKLRPTYATLPGHHIACGVIPPNQSIWLAGGKSICVGIRTEAWPRICFSLWPSARFLFPDRQAGSGWRRLGRIHWLPDVVPRCPGTAELQISWRPVNSWLEVGQIALRDRLLPDPVGLCNSDLCACLADWTRWVLRQAVLRQVLQ